VEPRAVDRAQAKDLGVKAGDYAAFAVEDTGLGMSPETAARAAEPFFSTKGEAGTGLGLSAANSLAVAAGGALRIRTRLGHGTRVELLIPRARAAAQGQLDLVQPGAVAGLARDVLLVEDHPAVREETARLLREMGCRVTAVEDAEGAMDALTAGEPIDLMITDLSLPYGLDGRGLAEVARSLRPDLKVLFTSGYGPQGTDGAPDFLPKPFGRTALAAALQRQFARPSLQPRPE
jgi:CheY-like chemotaxis protein